MTSKVQRKKVRNRKYNDTEDEGLSLTEGYPGTPPPTPEGGWMPPMPAKIVNLHDPPAEGCHPPMAEDPVDIRRFELLVGRIKYTKVHPLRADSWMLTYVDVGFKFPLAIVSSIGKFYDKQSLERRKVVALCNIEPVEPCIGTSEAPQIRNVGNIAMLMCGAAPDPSDPHNLIYELWDVPPKARVGDPLRCENYPLKLDMISPERPFMHNYENVFNEIIADVRVNSLRQLTYKDNKLYVRGLKGEYITTPTLSDCGCKDTFI